jgi:hypothetical protein
MKSHSASFWVRFSGLTVLALWFYMLYFC